MFVCPKNPAAWNEWFKMKNELNVPLIITVNKQDKERWSNNKRKQELCLLVSLDVKV